MENINTSKQRVGIYCRVSTQEQFDYGNGIDVQINKIDAYLKLYDYDIDSIEYYIDEGISAKDLNRPKIKQLMEDVDTGKITMVVIYKLDRLSRNVTDVYTIIEKLNDNNCNLIAIMDRLDIHSANGRMMVGILAIISQWERETIAERTNEGLFEMAKKGKYPNGGKPPLGYRKRGSYLEIKKSEEKYVKQIFNLASEGYSLNEILHNVSLTGCNFASSDAIKRILKNKMYYGHFNYKGSVFDNIVPAIIDKELFERANEELSKRTSFVDLEKYYYGRLVRCSCGHPLLNKSTNKRGKIYCYYYCEKCSKRINQNVLLEQTLTRIQQQEDYENLSNQEKVIFRSIKSIEYKVENLYIKYLSKQIDEKVYGVTLVKLDQDHTGLMQQLKAVRPKPTIKWSKLKDMEKKHYIHQRVSSITIDLDLKQVLVIKYK